MHTLWDIMVNEIIMSLMPCNYNYDIAGYTFSTKAHDALK